MIFQADYKGKFGETAGTTKDLLDVERENKIANCGR
jgi:hypothetical protein